MFRLHNFIHLALASVDSIGGRCYHLTAPESEDILLPAIIWRVDGIRFESTKDGYAHSTTTDPSTSTALDMTCTATLDIVARTADDQSSVTQETIQALLAEAEREGLEISDLAIGQEDFGERYLEYSTPITITVEFT